MEDETLIIASLQQGVTAAVAASSVPTLPVAYIDVNFDVPSDGKWVEIVWIPNNRQGDFWGDEKNYQGLFRLVLHWPKDGGGIYAPLETLASIAGWFAKGRMVDGVQIYEQPDFTGSIPQDDETLYGCSIRYRSYRG